MSRTTNPLPSNALLFDNPFTFISRNPVTLVELRMRKFSGMIRSKPNWWEKVQDPQLIEKWRKEMVEQDREAVERLWGGEERFKHGRGTKQWPRDPITDAQLDYIFDQLQYDAARRDPETGIFAMSIPKVYESRSLIPMHLKSALLVGVHALESIPDEEKDWHPGSNQQVLDLVHPSLYCLRLDQSLVRSANSTGAESLHVLTFEEYKSRRPDLSQILQHHPFFISSKYQWLPTDFAVAEDGKASPLGYINNLHPLRNHELYSTISDVLSRFVPLFERVLSDMLNPDPPPAISVNPYDWYEHLEEPDWDEVREAQLDEDTDSEAEDNAQKSEWEDPEEVWERTVKWPLIPEPAPFSPPQHTDTNDRIEFSLHGRTLQVIVKLATIVLTPGSRARYPGGAWHVEGMANEGIVATGLYYYACANITESRLAFRATVGRRDASDMAYQHHDVQGFYAAYGFARYDALSQGLGHVVAEEGKCIAFPNVYQHRVEPFELADPSKPGYRKILCFFLADPLARIVSTTDVPPQQEDWMVEEVLGAPAIRALPAELSDMIVYLAKAEATIGRKEAERDREELMRERGNFVAKHNETVFEVEFRMCEH
ncbi:hypothetical protein GY45DRAFT_1272421 [Cubamyces sp. BRFM 1775]|nr:hypothetical protein GY45DRAFT_1272421 [Cubamyces sp. BRFM 1775]